MFESFYFTVDDKVRGKKAQKTLLGQTILIKSMVSSESAITQKALYFTC
jgi:hypothetical protein